MSDQEEPTMRIEGPRNSEAGSEGLVALLYLVLILLTLCLATVGNVLLIMLDGPGGMAFVATSCLLMGFASCADIRSLRDIGMVAATTAAGLFLVFLGFLAAQIIVLTAFDEDPGITFRWAVMTAGSVSGFGGAWSISIPAYRRIGFRRQPEAPKSKPAWPPLHDVDLEIREPPSWVRR